jgi:hypothetical protein
MGFRPGFKSAISMAAVSVLALVASPAAHAAPAHQQVGIDPGPRPTPFTEATRLSAFGERPAYSPDGKRIAFIGKSYGDAFEIELATGRVRNLTVNFPHQGFLRVQYLPNGDYLLVGPRRFNGPNTRANVEMWVLDRALSKGIQPLDEKLFEGVAISAKRNFISWMAFDPPLVLKPTEHWMMVAPKKPMKHYVGEIIDVGGTKRIANKREIMPTLPEGCQSMVEPQDFRDNDRELIVYCGGTTPQGGYLSKIFGYRLDTGAIVTYRNRPDEYNESEGISPDGTWDAVECGTPGDRPGPPALDICKLELKPGGKRTLLVDSTSSGSSVHVSNPVVSPDGKWLAFQASDYSSGEIGECVGIYIARVAN